MGMLVGTCSPSGSTVSTCSWMPKSKNPLHRDITEVDSGGKALMLMLCVMQYIFL